MSQLQDQLPGMFALARDRSEGSRVELAGKLADLFLVENAELSLREEELVNELIDQLMQTNTPAVRAQIVQRFADASRMPRGIARHLASDSIDVARKVLMACQTLTDEDLIPSCMCGVASMPALSLPAPASAKRWPMRWSRPAIFA